MRRLDDRGQPSICCPNCSRTSYSPMDVREGYCGACHAFTSIRLAFDAEASEELKKVVADLTKGQ